MIKKLTATLLTIVVIAQAFSQSTTADDYIRTYRPIAIKEMQRTGVPAAIKLAQGILESASGQSNLVMRSNNHFGIKCKSGYTGPYVLHDDDRPQERFMKYDSPEQSFIDHSDFLRTRSRYAFLFDLDPQDYTGWAYGLKKAGYATNPRYPQLLISIIEKYNLQNYTLIALGKADTPDDLRQSLVAAIEATPATPTAASKPQYPATEFKINYARVIFVKKGVALADVAQKYGVPLAHIYLFNDFRTNDAVASQDQLVYLQMKRTVGNGGFHEVKTGESLYDIAQQRGIRLESLLKYNQLSKTASLTAGTKLYLHNPSEKIALNQQGGGSGSHL